MNAQIRPPGRTLARRLADRTMFLWNGDIIEIDESDVIFSETPRSRKTYEYVNGIFG